MSFQNAWPQSNSMAFTALIQLNTVIHEVMHVVLRPGFDLLLVIDGNTF